MGRGETARLDAICSRGENAKSVEREVSCSPSPFPMDTYRGETLRLPIVETNIESPKFPSTRQLKWGHTGEGMIGQ